MAQIWLEFWGNARWIQKFWKWHVLVHSERYFLSVSFARKMLNFPPEDVIWWTLKMYFWEMVNTLLEQCRMKHVVSSSSPGSETDGEV